MLASKNPKIIFTGKNITLIEKMANLKEMLNSWHKENIIMGLQLHCIKLKITQKAIGFILLIMEGNRPISKH